MCRLFLFQLLYSEPVNISPAAVVGLDVWSGAENADLCANPFALLYLELVAQFLKLLVVGAVVELALNHKVVTAFALANL